MKIIQLTNKTEYQTMGYVLQAKTGEVIVVDGGDSGNEGELADVIRSLGGHVSLWLITHPHSDHHNAVMRIFREYKDITCEKLGSSLLPADWLAGQIERRELDEWETFLPEISDIFFEVRRGQTFSVGSVTVDVLTGANPDISVNPYNNQSCVYRMAEDDFTMIFLGDLGIEGGERFLSLCPGIRCDGVQMAHHGQQGVKEDVYQSLRPSYAFWATPRWLWDNCSYLGGGEPGSGPFKTPEVEAWAAKLGCINITSFDETTVFDTESLTAYPYWKRNGNESETGIRSGREIRMYRLYFCPLWRRDRAEAYCERMEAQGYRLEKVLFSCLYRFREAPARGGSYVFLYSFPKDADLKYFDMEKELCTTFRGMQICGKGLFEEEVFRITVKNEELPYLLRTRDVFIRRGLIQRILISAFFSAIFLVFILPSDSRFLTGFAACTLAYLVYHLTGLVLLTQHMRKNEKQKF